MFHFKVTPFFQFLFTKGQHFFYYHSTKQQVNNLSSVLKRKQFNLNGKTPFISLKMGEVIVSLIKLTAILGKPSIVYARQRQLCKSSCILLSLVYKPTFHQMASLPLLYLRSNHKPLKVWTCWLVEAGQCTLVEKVPLKLENILHNFWS